MSKSKSRRVGYDCKYFLGDRPCSSHKQKGVLCKCEYFTPLKESLLIIKLDAMGDVLRTTCLLPIMVKKWPGVGVTWLTREESVPLLENNPYIKEVVPYKTDALVHISSRRFDRVINLDASKISAGLATIAKASEKIGYILHEEGYVIGTNAAAGEWLRMGIFDDLKRANQCSYQEIMCSIVGLPTKGMKYVLELTEAEKEEGRSHLLMLGLDLNKSIIGIHTGGGARWPLKKWSERNFGTLIRKLLHELRRDGQILLFGGPSEREVNKSIKERVATPIFDAGCDNEVRHFAALINCCSVVVSGDSFAMHAALAMGRRTVVLFGPTSSKEIELFGLGERVVPDMDCLACYKTECDINPNCMDSISADTVRKAVIRQLRASR